LGYFTIYIQDIGGFHTKHLKNFVYLTWSVVNVDLTKPHRYLHSMKLKKALNLNWGLLRLDMHEHDGFIQWLMQPDSFPGKSVGICACKRRMYIQLILIGKCEITQILPFSQNHLAGCIIGWCAHKMLTWLQIGEFHASFIQSASHIFD
jgi:hypothetical protein